MKKIPIYLENLQIQGDTTQFMQQSLLFKILDVPLVVYLPLVKEYFDNPEVTLTLGQFMLFEAGIEQSIEQTIPDDFAPVLTLDGIYKLRKIVRETLTPKHSYASNVVDEEDYDF